MKLTITVTGFLQYPIGGGLTSGSWKSQMMSMVAEYLGPQTRERFAVTKTSPSGAKWAPWVKPYKGVTLLVRTGRLMSGNATGSNESAAWITNNVPYAGFIQGGTKKMVAREFLGISADNAREIEGGAARLLQSFLV